MITPRKKMHKLIVSEALVMFKTQGVKAVRMDDVAKGLRISKRTLYEHFDDKEHLLLECVKLSSVESAAAYANHAAKGLGVMDMLCFFIKKTLEEFSNYNPNFYIEVVKYKSVREFVDERKLSERKAQQAFISKGIEQGLFLDNINFELLHHINKCALESLIREKIYEKYPLRDIFYTFIMVFLRGLLTEKGLKEFNKAFEKIM